MSEKIAWSINAGSPGGSLDASGTVETDSVTTASVSIDAGAESELALDLSDLDKVDLLAVTASAYGETLTVKAGDGEETPLHGPLVLFRGAIALLGDSLATLTVKNDGDASVDLAILVARKLA